ncbi:MAG: endonuclease NucS, partial [Candidatus Woesearchaeota archaeon]
EMIVIGCRCTVRYSGRAESTLAEGDRVVIIKRDKTLLIHQPTGSLAVNYMKPGSSHKAFLEKGVLFIKSKNLASKEWIDIVITKVYFLNSAPLEDCQSILLSGTEEDMVDMILANPEIIEAGFKPVAKEEQTKYGFIDLLGTDKNGQLTVVECKRYCADPAAVTQLRRYVEKVMSSKGLKRVRGILAAPKITANALQMLLDWGFEFRKVTPPKYFEEFDTAQSRLERF